MGTGISPEKLLVVLFIALIVLGPDKLPELARKAGKAWSDLRRYRESLESEVRGAFGVSDGNPFASPLSFLTDPPPPTGPAGEVVAPPPPVAGTAPVGGDTGPDGSTGAPPGPDGAPAETSPAPGTAEDWAATVTAGWGLGASQVATPPPGGPLGGDSGNGSGDARSGAGGSGAGGSGVTEPDAGQVEDAWRPAAQVDARPAAWSPLRDPLDDPSLN